jgi:hypothetical protein
MTDYPSLADLFNAAAQRFTTSTEQIPQSRGNDRRIVITEANNAALELDRLLPRLLVAARRAGYQGDQSLALITHGENRNRAETAWAKLSSRWVALHLAGVKVTAPPESELAAMCPCGRASV